MTKVSNARIQGSESSIVELDLAALSAVAGGGRDPDQPDPVPTGLDPDVPGRMGQDPTNPMGQDPTVA